MKKTLNLGGIFRNPSLGYQILQERNHARIIFMAKVRDEVIQTMPISALSKDIQYALAHLDKGHRNLEVITEARDTATRMTHNINPASEDTHTFEHP